MRVAWMIGSSSTSAARYSARPNPVSSRKSFAELRAPQVGLEQEDIRPEVARGGSGDADRDGALAFAYRGARNGDGLAAGGARRIEAACGDLAEPLLDDTEDRRRQRHVFDLRDQRRPLLCPYLLVAGRLPMSDVCSIAISCRPLPRQRYRCSVLPERRYRQPVELLRPAALLHGADIRHRAEQQQPGERLQVLGDADAVVGPQQEAVQSRAQADREEQSGEREEQQRGLLARVGRLSECSARRGRRPSACPASSTSELASRSLFCVSVTASCAFCAFAVSAVNWGSVLLLAWYDSSFDCASSSCVCSLLSCCV